MKVLAALLLSFSLPAFHTMQAPTPTPVETRRPTQARQKGTWYFADNGHAVYCFGPVVVVPDAQGSLQRIATFCRGEKTMVPLRD